MAKPPAFQFYPNDWARDLEEHPLEVEGAWIRICCKLWWSNKRGSVTKTLQQWARILRESQEKTFNLMQYIQAENIGNVTPDLQNISLENLNCNGCVTVESRRMVNDEKERELTRLRVKRHREKKTSNAPVTQKKQHSSSSTSLNTYTSDFLKFWESYPKKVGKKNAFKIWQRAKDKPSIDQMLSILEKHKKSKAWIKDKGQYIPHLATWLNQGRWEDELEGHERDSYYCSNCQVKLSEMEFKSGKCPGCGADLRLN